jgi:hypothetical protein
MLDLAFLDAQPFRSVDTLKKYNKTRVATPLARHLSTFAGKSEKEKKR